LRKGLVLSLALVVFARATVRAQTPIDSAKTTPGIEDNSFLVEEAYNQDAGVVQEISGLSIDKTNKSYEYDFTQEWPVGSIRHQLSYTIPLLHTKLPRSTRVGDVLLNYRYQLVGDGDAALAVSPRFSLALPTGDWKNDAGRGAVGYEAFLPASIRTCSSHTSTQASAIRLLPTTEIQIAPTSGNTHSAAARSFD
jgi:hypothetical protein